MITCAKPYRGWSALYRGLSTAGIMAAVLFAASCSGARTALSYSVEDSRGRIDSVSLRVERLTKTAPVPASRAILTLTVDSIAALPAGAKFTASQGQATVAVQRTEGGMIEASANCDSLTLLVDELRTEIFHLNREKTEIKTELNEQKIVEVNRLTPWQAFQVWTGRICLALLVITVIYKRLKNKKS